MTLCGLPAVFLVVVIGLGVVWRVMFSGKQGVNDERICINV